MVYNYYEQIKVSANEKNIINYENVAPSLRIYREKYQYVIR